MKTHCCCFQKTVWLRSIFEAFKIDGCRLGVLFFKLPYRSSVNNNYPDCGFCVHYMPNKSVILLYHTERLLHISERMPIERQSILCFICDTSCMLSPGVSVYYCSVLLLFVHFFFFCFVSRLMYRKQSPKHKKPVLHNVTYVTLACQIRQEQSAWNSRQTSTKAIQQNPKNAAFFRVK